MECLKTYSEFSEDEEIEENSQNTDAPVSSKKNSLHGLKQDAKIPAVGSVSVEANKRNQMDANYDHVQMDMSENSSEDERESIPAKKQTSEVATKKKRESPTKRKSSTERDFSKRRERSSSRDRDRDRKYRERDREKDRYSRSSYTERCRERDYRRDDNKNKSKNRDERKSSKHDRRERDRGRDYERRDRDRSYYKDKERERTRDKRSVSKDKEPKTKLLPKIEQRVEDKSEPKPASIINSELIKQTQKIQATSSSIEQFIANVQIKKPSTEVILPAYYNAAIVNPTRYADQMQKRKLLWSHKKEEETTNPNVSKWESAKFSQDTDGKVASKFLRLMGVKDTKSKSTETKPEDSIKKQEELFCTMEQQYEVARQATHTMRGVGLGFGSAPKPF